MDIQRQDVGKRRAKRHIAAGAAALAFLSLAAFAWSLSDRPPAVDRDGLWNAQVTRGELVHEISASGSLVAPELRAVTNRSEGVVERILVLPGHVVEAADGLIEMSSPQLEDDLDNARWSLEAALAEEKLLQVELENGFLDVVATLANAEAEYTSARLELEAQEELGRQQIASQLEIQRARLRAEQWRKRFDAEQARLDRYDEFRAAQEAAADARLSQLRQQVDRLVARVADLKVRAGIAGVVQEINVQEGERLTQGQAVARIVNPRNLIARVGVSERDAARVQAGLPVRIEMGRETVAGKVTRVDPTVRDRLVTIDVALLGEPSPALRPDLSVTARIELERVDDVLILDRPVGLRADNETLELFRLVGDGARAERVTVEIGRASARQVEIVQGLEAGDRVILADMSDWLEEAVIRIR